MYRQLTTTTQLQIAAIMKTSAPHITVEFVEVQRQNGSDDCGAYAIAFAAALSLGKNPWTLTFAESDIRKHLFNMLNNKKLQLFPVIKKRRGVRVTQGEPIQVYCSCRMPDVGEMIECSGCGEWYHMPSCATADQQTKMHLMTQTYIGIVIVVTSYYSYTNIGTVVAVASNLFCSL